MYDDPALPKTTVRADPLQVRVDQIPKKVEKTAAEIAAERVSDTRAQSPTPVGVCVYVYVRTSIFHRACIG